MNGKELARAIVAARPGTDESEWLHCQFRLLSFAEQLRCMAEMRLCRAAKRGEFTAELA